MTMKRTTTKRKVAGTRRVYRVVKVTKTILQCERPYVLFGEELRRQRLHKEWTQQELADKLKVSRGSIANIEVGRQRVLLSDLFDFADVLGIRPRIFFDAVQD
jgi:DNA-binding XRE family transcriptional regulator